MSTVYIIDDDQLSRDALATLVKSMGSKCESFDSGPRFLEQYSGGPGCVVADVRMPGMTGVELLTRLRELGRGVPVVMISGYADVHTAVTAMQRGAVTFLEKSARPLEIWDAIVHALEFDESQREFHRELDSIRERLKALSREELDVLELVVDGVSNKAIASKLDVSVRTVEDRRQRIFKKMKSHGLTDLVRQMTSLREAERVLSLLTSRESLAGNSD